MIVSTPSMFLPTSVSPTLAVLVTAIPLQSMSQSLPSSMLLLFDESGTFTRISSSSLHPSHSSSLVSPTATTSLISNPSTSLLKVLFHAMITRSKNSIFKPKRLYQASTKHHFPIQLNPPASPSPLNRLNRGKPCLMNWQHFFAMEHGNSFLHLRIL